MSNLLLLLVAGIYVYVAGDLTYQGKHGLGISFFAYAIANIGFVIANRGL